MKKILNRIGTLVGRRNRSQGSMGGGQMGFLRRYVLAGLAMLIALTGGGLFFGARALASPSSQAVPNGFMYTVKFTCVPEVGFAEGVGAGTADAPFLPSLYRTAINVHNPQPFTLGFLKKAVVARSEENPRGQISAMRKDFLGPDGALDIDCLTVENLLGPPGSPRPGDGYVVIESPRPLDVSAVYTSQIIGSPTEQGHGVGTAIDVEYIQAKVIHNGVVSLQ